MRLQLSRRIFIPPSVVGTIFGGVAVDGGGGILVGGHFHPIPPWGPGSGIAEQLANYLCVSQIANVGVRMQAQRSALQALTQVTSARLAQLQPLRSPAPQVPQAQAKKGAKSARKSRASKKNA